MKYQVDLYKLKECIDFLKEVNSQNLDNLEVFHNGKYRYINPICIEEWRFVALNNVEFLKDYFKDELG